MLGVDGICFKNYLLYWIQLRKNMELVLQMLQPDTSWENLLLQVTSGHDYATERAVEAFPVLGARLAQSAGTMSGGEQQMLALARAYISNPRIVLLDEVSMGLAPRIVDEIFEFLERLAREGASLLLVEQYVTRALALADYVYMLNRGSLVFVGEPAELVDEDVFARYLGTEVNA